MAAPVAKCAAAKGLSGDNLLCIDFDKVTQLSDPALAGWNFSANMADCWQISAGMLSVKNFATFTGNCGLTLPPLDFKQAAKANYQRATLAIVHRVDLSDIDQKAQVFLDIDDPSTRLIHQTTSRPAIPTLTTTTLTVSSSAISGRQGWQIQSIAVNTTQ
jgi:hypothetical protein